MAFHLFEGAGLGRWNANVDGESVYPYPWVPVIELYNVVANQITLDASAITGCSPASELSAQTKATKTKTAQEKSHPFTEFIAGKVTKAKRSQIRTILKNQAKTLHTRQFKSTK